MSVRDLPDVYMITNDDFEDVETLIKKVDHQLNQGIRLVQLRIKKKKDAGYDFYAKKLLDLCNRYSANLVLNHTIKSFPDVNCYGIHMTSSELMETKSIPDAIREKYTISCPVHNDQELAQANALKLDFAILTPIQKSFSSPGAPFIGWDGAKKLLKETNIPLYAAGGMRVSDLNKVKELGFVGIASIGSLW